MVPLPRQQSVVLVQLRQHRGLPYADVVHGQQDGRERHGRQVGHDGKHADYGARRLLPVHLLRAGVAGLGRRGIVVAGRHRYRVCALMGRRLPTRECDRELGKRITQRHGRHGRGRRGRSYTNVLINVNNLADLFVL